jgi:hypothetical protein
MQCPNLRRAVACNLQACRFQDLAAMQDSKPSTLPYLASTDLTDLSIA